MQRECVSCAGCNGTGLSYDQDSNVLHKIVHEIYLLWFAHI